MSRSSPGPKPELTCWDCGAKNHAGARECWLCHRRDWLSEGVVFREAGGAANVDSDRPGRMDGEYSWLSPFLLGCLSAAGLFFVIVIMPILTLLSGLASLFQICTGQTH